MSRDFEPAMGDAMRKGKRSLCWAGTDGRRCTPGRLHAMDNRNAWTSSAMLSGLVLHGDRRKELQVLVAMVREGHGPVVAAYVGVLNACRRAR